MLPSHLKMHPNGPNPELDSLLSDRQEIKGDRVICSVNASGEFRPQSVDISRLTSLTAASKLIFSFCWAKARFYLL